MKRTWCKVLLAGVAATALVLAAGCSDGSSEDWSGAEQVADESAQDAQAAEEEQGTQAELRAITQDDVLELIQEIDYVDGHNGRLYPDAYWNFAAPELSEDDGGLLAIISWARLNFQTSPYIYHTLNYLQQKGKVSTSLLSVDLSKAEWDESTDERTQTEIMSSGYRYATVKIELAEGASAELPEELGAITIAFDSDGIAWRNIVGY